ncbi:MAG: SH3 domain-containing protein [Prochlorococcus sp.]
MVSMGFVLRWSCLLAMALVAPATLPAGGAERRQPEVRRRGHCGGPMLAGQGCALKSSPLTVAPTLRTVEVGTPMKILRQWKCVNGQDWLHVQIANGDGGMLVDVVRRGWINV